ncbi:hypothetical protein AB0383_35340 [Amycolatopsis sp. NPDC051373]|uniref:hypothetical protein n=1 Tax=Amycolatopsis sp. NPDC051373 TaxID=3155801 RepID=UPI003450B12D
MADHFSEISPCHGFTARLAHSDRASRVEICYHLDMTSEESPEMANQACAGALSLLTLPYVFTQDKLLTSGDFIKAAEERGHRLSLDDLQALHSHRLLLPLYRVSDCPVEGRRVPIELSGAMNIDVRRRTFEAAVSGRLRDSSREGYSIDWPYRRPEGEKSRNWWNGFVYSSWQVLNIDFALQNYEFIKLGWPLSPQVARNAEGQRKVALTLSALATRYLPGVIGNLHLPSDVDENRLRAWRVTSEIPDLLAFVGANSSELVAEAELFLLETRSDPAVKWLPLIRHASYQGWSKLRGEPLDAMWRRVAAELLLGAYEELAGQGIVASLPDLTGATWHSPQHDRLAPRYEEAETLEAALTDLGLSPHPKVLLLVEGETERYHFPKLLAEFGMGQPQDIRVQHAKGSNVNPHLVARYNVAPRVGRKLNEGWLLDSSSTALLVVMDPENKFKTVADRENISRILKDSIREEVQLQEAEINEDELDFLVRVRVWGDDKYEIANFTDDELVAAITQLAKEQHNDRVERSFWEDELRAALENARRHHKDIKEVFWPLRIREDKVNLAKLLWPSLRDKCEKEYVAGNIVTPALKIVIEAREIVGRLNGRFLIGGR